MGCHALSYSVWFVVDRATCCNTFPHTKLISYSVVYYSSMWGSEFLKTLWKMEERRDPDLSHSWPFYLKHCQRRVHVYELWACKGISAYQFADVRGDKKINKNTAKIREKFEKKNIIQYIFDTLISIISQPLKLISKWISPCEDADRRVQSHHPRGSE